MGKHLISNLKRVGYVGAAAVLTLVAMPIMPIAEAWADALATEVGSCDELAAALADDNTTINLTTNLTGCSTATVAKGKTIDGGGNSIAFVSNDGFYINTNEAVQFKDLSITAAQMGIVVPDGGATASNLTFDGVTIDALYRGLSYYETQDGAKLTIKDSMIQNSSITNYDTDWSDAAGHPAGTRGISFGEFKHSTANITDTTIQGFKYVVNFTQYSDVGSTFNLSGVTLKGWADLNLWQSDATINVTDSDLLGIMAKSDTSAWNNFGDIKFNDGANYNKLTLTNVRLKNAYPYATEGGVAQQAMLIDYGSHNSITMENCDFDDTLPGRLEYEIWEAGSTDITVSSGVYDLPVEEAYLADGKVNYLVDGRYVVDDAPVVDNVPARVLVEAGVDAGISGLDDDSIQSYGEFEANGGSFTKPNILNATRLSNSSDLKLTFGIYNYNQDGDIVRDDSYDKVTKVHAYRAEKVDDIFVARGSSKNDIALDFASNPYTIMEVKTSDESIATIAKNAEGNEYTVTASDDKDGIVTILGKVSVGGLATDWIELGTVNVYSYNIKREVTVPVGTTINLTNGIISEIGNPSVVDVELDSTDYATLSGTTAEGSLTTTAVGTATLTFKVGDEMVGTTDVKVYEAQKPEDVVLSVNGVGADEWQHFALSGTNLPGYDLTIENENIAKTGVVRSFIIEYCDTIFVVGNREKCIDAVRAGKTKATVTYRDSMDTPTMQEFYVHVSRYTESNNKPWYEFDSSYEYDVTVGDEVEFRLTEGYGQDSITLEDDHGLTVEHDEGGNYVVTIPEGTEGGTYTLKFTDTVAGKKIAEREVTIRVHEIVTSEDELYVKKSEDNTVTIEAKEKNGYGNICSRVGTIFENCNVEVYDVTGARTNGVTVEHASGDNFDITVNRAGQYTVRFSDGTAFKDVTVYGIDFEVKDLEYHIKTTDTAQNLVNAINRYWVDTKNGVVRNILGFETNSIIMTKVTSGSVSAEGEDYFFWPSENANAGRYTVEFSALINGEVVDTQTVTIYLYEMYHPTQTEYYGEMRNFRNLFSVSVGDWINWTVPGMAQVSYEVTEGDSTGIIVNTTTGLVYVTKPGKYVVKYIDTMNRGEGDMVGEYTATFEVYNLDANAPDNQIVDISAAELYSYTINHTNTYGDVEVTITLTHDGETEEVFSETLNYPGETINDFEFTPTEEGLYNVRIRNLSAAEHNYNEVETGSFYVIVSEYDFMMVKAGETVEIVSNSYWGVTSAYLDSDRIAVEEGKKVTVDTTDMDLGVYNVNLYHRFSRRQREAVKRVTLVVYDVAPGEDTKELNPGEVTVSTIEGLYKDTAKATAELVEKMVAKKIPAAQIMDFMNKLWDGALTDEDVEALGLTDLFNELKTAFGTKDNEWIDTVNNLNEAASFGDEVTISVEVTPINDSVDATEKADIENALSKYSVDHIDYYDVSVLLKVNGDELGKIHKLNGQITVALATVESPADGYTRQYFVVRDHDGTVTVLTEGVDFYIEDGVIYVISDEFSTYAVAYKDTLVPKSPDTGEEVVAEGDASVSASTAIVIAIATITVAGAFVLAKRK